MKSRDHDVKPVSSMPPPPEKAIGLPALNDWIYVGYSFTELEN